MTKNPLFKHKFILLVLYLSLWVPISSYAIAIEGQVVDNFGKPLPGAQVSVPEKSSTIETDRNGKFALNFPELQKIEINISASNYCDQKIQFNRDSHDLLIKLTPKSSGTLETLTGNVDLRRFNGSAQILSANEIEDIPTDILSNTLAGRIAGLAAIQADGALGYDGASLYLRGTGGILVFIDGRRADFRDVAIEDIEKVQVLKDGASAAIYGTRGSAGAILITTKSGKVGAPKVSFKSQVAFNELLRIPTSVDAPTHATLYNNARQNDGLDNFYTSEDIDLFRNGSSPLTHPNVNWKDALLNNGYWSNKYHIDVTGGNSALRYYVAMNINTTQGMFNTDESYNYDNNNDVNDYKLLSNIEFNPWKKTVVRFRMSGEMQKSSYPWNAGNYLNIYHNLYKVPSTEFPMYIPVFEGDLYFDQTGNTVTPDNGKIISGNSNFVSPWAQLNRSGYGQTNLFKGMVQTSVDQDLSSFVPGLKAGAMIYFTIFLDENLDRSIDFSKYEYMDDGTLYKRDNDGNMTNVLNPQGTNRYLSYETYLNYNRVFGRHQVTSHLLWNRYENANDETVAARYESLSLSVGYCYDNRYSLDANLTYGGVYKFSKGNKYDDYPYIAAGWTISNEKFFTNIKDVFSYAKIRSSYGIMSANDASAFSYLGNLKQVGRDYNIGNNMGGVNGIFLQNVANYALTDGRVHQFNLGIDLGFMKDKLEIRADYFTDKKMDMAITPDRSYSQIFGWQNVPDMNLGSDITKGFEIYANYSGGKGAFKYNIGGTFSRQENEILDRDEPLNLPYEWMYKKGNSKNSTYGYVADGLIRTPEELTSLEGNPAFATPQLGDIKYIDLNEDGVIDPVYDQKRIGYGSIPQIAYGIFASASYKGFDMSILFQGVTKCNRMLSGAMRNPFAGNTTVLDFQTDGYHAENTDGSWPAYSTTASNNNNVSSTFWLRDASYLRLKNLSLGYTIPVRLTEKLRMSRLRLYASGYNLLLWDHMDVLDPETSADGSAIPAPRTYSFGINVTF